MPRSLIAAAGVAVLTFGIVVFASGMCVSTSLPTPDVPELPSPPDVPELPSPPDIPFAELATPSITRGVKDGIRPVIGCVKVARTAGELPPGRYTLTLDWDILPDGTISNPEMTGPARLLHTSLPECFAARMRSWRFPASTRGGPVRNFPFGPFEVE